MLNKEELLKLKKRNKLFKEAAKAINAQEEHLPRTIKKFLREIDELKKEINSYLKE